MKKRHIAFAILTVAALGGVWITYDDGFGRPQTTVDREEDFRTVTTPPPAPGLHSATFTVCAGSARVNCVVDGDTIWFTGEKYRIADIDAPEIFEPECSQEKQAGEAARDRLVTLLNAGPFSMTSGWRDQDRYGRKLRNIVRLPQSLGETLVEESLARRWDGPRFGWCESNGA